jgi:WD40 repeat protein
VCCLCHFLSPSPHHLRLHHPLCPCCTSLQVHVGNIVDLAWTPDGYTLITCSNDDTISVIRCGAAQGCWIG